MNFINTLKQLYACDEAINWLEENKFNSLQEAWQVCKRADWMIWLLNKYSGGCNSKLRKKLTLTTCEIARTVLHIFETKYPNDKRPRICLETTEKWASNQDGVTYDDVVKSRDDCWKAYYDFGLRPVAGADAVPATAAAREREVSVAA